MIALNTDLEISLTTPIIFTGGVKKVQNLHLRRYGFETKQRIDYLFSSFKVSMMARRPQI